MYPNLSLKENITHGTPQNPIHALHFENGAGTPYKDHFFVKRHWHSYVELLHIVKGSYVFEINLENHILKEGDLCLLNSEELHQITGNADFEVHDVILFDPRILGFSYADEWQEVYNIPFLNHSLIFRNIIHPEDIGYSDVYGLFQTIFEAALEQQKDWYISCKLLILQFFSFMATHHMLLPAREVTSVDTTRKILRYKTIISYMEKHYQEPVSLQQLADSVSCNSQYLCRSFREIAGMSPIQYLISYRLERACSLLTHTTRSITEIALDCGFDNISYFIRKFKEVKGCTPKEYRAGFSLSEQIDREQPVFRR